MTNDLANSDLLKAKAGADKALAAEYAASAKADQTQAEALQESAAELEAESAREKTLAETYLAQEEELNAKVGAEQTEADGLGAEAAANEDIFQEETEKSLAETTAAARDAAEKIGRAHV